MSQGEEEQRTAKFQFAAVQAWYNNNEHLALSAIVRGNFNFFHNCITFRISNPHSWTLAAMACPTSKIGIFNFTRSPEQTKELKFKMGIITNEIKEFVNKQRLGFVATVCPDGTPNLSPKGTTVAWDDQYLVFADIYSPGTIANLLANPSVEINVVDVFTRKGYRFKGVAKVFSEGTIFNEVVNMYRNAGSRHTIKNIALIEVNRVLPIISPAYDTNASEIEISDRWIEYWNTIHSKK